MTNLQFAAEIQSYEDAKRFLGNESARTLAYKTRVVNNADGIAVQHHHTNIVTYHENGSITLDNGGWHTRTTSHRMHRLTPDSVHVFISDRVMRVEADTLNGQVSCAIADSVTLVL